MLCRRVLTIANRAAKPKISPSIVKQASFSTTRCVKATPENDDPDMNGGYINPPAIKRIFRDPYGSYTHPQERRNFGEPVHEDNDILGVFALDEYTHMTPGRGAIMWLGFISCVLGLSSAVYLTYPDLPSAPREYVDGLEAELGGPGAMRARKTGDEPI